MILMRVPLIPIQVEIMVLVLRRAEPYDVKNDGRYHDMDISKEKVIHKTLAAICWCNCKCKRFCI